MKYIDKCIILYDLCNKWWITHQKNPPRFPGEETGAQRMKRGSSLLSSKTKEETTNIILILNLQQHEDLCVIQVVWSLKCVSSSNVLINMTFYDT